MTLKLSRLQRGVSYYDKDGKPTTQMQLLWQQTMERIEAAVNGLELALDAASRVEPASASKAFTADYNGTLDPTNQLPATARFVRLRDGVDVSGDATWSIVTQGTITGGTVTVTDGTATIPAGCTIPAATTITVRSVYAGVTVDVPWGVTKSNAAPPSTGGGGGASPPAQDTTFGSISGTSFTTISNTMTVTTGAVGRIDFAIDLETIAEAAANAGTFEVEFQWRHRPIAGAWTTVTAVLNDADAVVETESGFYYASNGFSNAMQNATGLSATTDYEVELQARRTGASPAKTITFAGTATATPS